MKHNTEFRSCIAEIHNGSSLFTGDAGQSESNIRRYVIENDWLEAIIVLPLNLFYNTGIATSWVAHSVIVIEQMEVMALRYAERAHIRE